MIYNVSMMLPYVGKYLNGTGADPSVEPGTSQCIEGLNRVTRMLMEENRTTVNAYIRVPVGPDGMVTLDRRIRAIISAKIPGHDQMNVVGQSYEFLDGVDFLNLSGVDCGMERIQFVGNNFVVQQELDRPRLLFAVSDRPDDTGKSVTVTGLDAYGMEVRNAGVKGIQVPIVQKACNVSPQLPCTDGNSSGQVAKVTNLTKPVTKGYVELWGYDNIDGTVRWITTLAPDETAPGFTRYQLIGAAGERVRCLYCYVIMQFAPMYDLNDISLVQQPDAIGMMTQAVAMLDKQDYGGYQNFRNAAVAWIRRAQKTEYGTHFRINVQVNRTPLQGDSYTMRPLFGRRIVRR